PMPTVMTIYDRSARTAKPNIRAQQLMQALASSFSLRWAGPKLGGTSDAPAIALVGQVDAAVATHDTYAYDYADPNDASNAEHVEVVLSHQYRARFDGGGKLTSLRTGQDIYVRNTVSGSCTYDHETLPTGTPAFPSEASLP